MSSSAARPNRISPVHLARRYRAVATAQAPHGEGSRSGQVRFMKRKGSRMPYARSLAASPSLGPVQSVRHIRCVSRPLRFGSDVACVRLGRMATPCVVPNTSGVGPAPMRTRAYASKRDLIGSCPGGGVMEKIRRDASLMTRKRATGWLLLSMMIASVLVCTAEAASAGTGRLNAPGSVTCSFSASISFSPRLSATGGGTKRSSIKASQLTCSTSYRSVVITKAAFTGRFAHSPLSCAAKSVTGVPVIGTAKWTSGTYGGRGVHLCRQRWSAGGRAGRSRALRT